MLEEGSWLPFSLNVSASNARPGEAERRLPDEALLPMFIAAFLFLNYYYIINEEDTQGTEVRYHHSEAAS